MPWLALALLACAARGPAAPETESWDLEQKDAVRLHLVETLLDRGRDEAALEAISSLRAEGVDPEVLDLLQARALVNLRLHTEAIALLESGGRRWGGVERWELLGLARFGARDLNGAIAAFDRAIELAERKEPAALPDLYNNLGFALDSAGRSERAIVAYRAALAIDPSMTRARNNLGFALGALGHDDEALASFQAAIPPTDPQDPESAERARQADAWYNLGLARQLRGDDALAQAAFQRALSFAPDHARAQRALASLSLEAAQDPTQNPTQNPAESP